MCQVSHIFHKCQMVTIVTMSNVSQYSHLSQYSICHNVTFVTLTVFTFVTMSHLSQYSHMSQQLQWSSGHNIRFVTFVTILSLYLQTHTKN